MLSPGVGGGRRRRLAARAALVLVPALLLGQLALPATVGAMTYETYTMTGYEVFYAPTQAVFVGAGSRLDGPRELSGWYTSVDHTLSVSPGSVTGGSAELRRIDGVTIQGDFVAGTVVQTDPGYNCSTETHIVTAHLMNVTRTDQPGVVGTAYLTATLTHFHTWIFGGCWTYSAKVDGTITVTV